MTIWKNNLYINEYLNKTIKKYFLNILLKDTFTKYPVINSFNDILLIIFI